MSRIGIPASRPITSTTTISGPTSILTSAFGTAPTDIYHQGGCFSVQYTTNSYGARDVERSLHFSKPRTVVLGDSMIEGLGLADQDRLTNILEKDTGREYLNFGTSGDFGPLQYALLYKTLAAKFDHDTVVVGLLPDNDFHDMSPEWGKVHHADRYRPYFAD